MHERVAARKTDSFWAQRGKEREESAWWQQESAELELEPTGTALDAPPIEKGGVSREDEPAIEEEDEEERNSRAHAHIQTLPTTELELHHLLLRLAKSEPPKSATRLRALHSHDVFRHLVSARTYSYLLHLALKGSNRRLFSSILTEMEERGIARTESVWRLYLKQRMKVGATGGVREAVAGLKRLGVRPVVTLNWRRDLGETAKGKGDPRRRAWQEWDKVQAGLGSTAQDPRASRKGQAKAKSASAGAADSKAVFSARDSFFARQPTQIHQPPRKLSNQDITALIQSFLLDGTAPDAFAIAEQWLTHNKPRAVPPPGQHDPSQLRYTSTALVLLNILLRSLVSTSPVPSDLAIRSFVREFATRHAVRPGEVTLRELVDSYRYRPKNTARRNGWLRAKSMVEWFIRNYGVPGSTAPTQQPAALTAGHAASAHLCSTQVSVLLLNLAVKQPAGPEESKYQREFVWKLRTWWAQAKLHRLAREGSLGQLGNRRAGLLVDAAIRKGLLEEPEGWKEKEEKRKRKKQKKEARDALWE